MYLNSIFNHLTSLKVKSKTKLIFGCMCVFERVRAQANLRRAMSEMTGGPLHPSWLSLHLWEGNLDGCNQNESEERPILRAINIEPKSAEKWQMWFRSDLSLQVFRVLTAPHPNSTPSRPDMDQSLSFSACMMARLPVHLTVLQSLLYTILSLIESVLECFNSWIIWSRNMFSFWPRNPFLSLVCKSDFLICLFILFIITKLTRM